MISQAGIDEISPSMVFTWDHPMPPPIRRMTSRTAVALTVPPIVMAW